MLRTIKRRLEYNTIFGNLSELCKTEYLITAAVSKYGTIPPHKIMQAAEFVYYICARPEVKMKCIPKDNLSAALTHLLRCNPFNSPCCTDRHEGRCVNYPMRGCKPAKPGRCIRVF